jgi:hypothetical protein
MYRIEDAGDICLENAKARPGMYVEPLMMIIDTVTQIMT